MDLSLNVKPFLLSQREQDGREVCLIPQYPSPSPPPLCRPNGLIYQKFRSQFLAFSIFQSECLLSTFRGGGMVHCGFPVEAPSLGGVCLSWRGEVTGGGPWKSKELPAPQVNSILPLHPQPLGMACPIAPLEPQTLPLSFPDQSPPLRPTHWCWGTNLVFLKWKYMSLFLI